MSIFNYREGIMQGTNGVGIKGIQQLPLATNIKLEGKSAIKEASRSEFLEKFEKIKSENVKEELENMQEMKKDFEELLKDLEAGEIDDEEAQEIYDEIVDMLEGSNED